MAQAVERILGKDEVGGSSPPSSSRKKPLLQCKRGFFNDIRFLFFMSLVIFIPHPNELNDGDDGSFCSKPYAQRCILFRHKAHPWLQAQGLRGLFRAHAIPRGWLS